MAGSIQWKAVADTIRSKGPLPVRSSKEHTRNRTPGFCHVAAGSRHHGRADIDGGHVERLASQLPGELVCAAADFQDSGDQIRFDIEDQRLTWTLLGEVSDEDEERLDQLRHRLNVLINADLRYSFGQ